MNDYIKAREDVANFLGIKSNYLSFILYKKGINNLYTSFEIPKKNGDNREINAPRDDLKQIQKQLSIKLNEIHKRYLEKNGIKQIISYGFEKEKGIIKNALVHKHKKYVLNMDISNFFPSFHFGRVQGYFYKSKEFNFSKEMSVVIAQLACYQGRLPQGAPSSPVISNLIFNIVDLRILELAKKYKLNYTRYVDDLSFSTNDKNFGVNYEEFICELTELLEKNKFYINKKKTRLVYQNSRQEVTGLTVNDRINANNKFIKDTRAMLNLLYKKNQFFINNKIGDINQLEGRLSFINQLDRSNNISDYKIRKRKLNKNYISGLNAREKQYQYFLFYKYFFYPSKPTIVTEGKTDILHVKASLMKYYNKYPNLITKHNSGKFEFKVNFLHKTKRLSYLLGISVDGADTMKNIWNFYTGNHGYYNIYEYLNKKNPQELSDRINPVILLFDNEQKTKRPLKEFLNHTDTVLEQGMISKKLLANLYLQTIPIIGKSEECEIEDLYLKELLDTPIDGKKFCKNAKDNSKDYVGKHIFSLYVIKHYKEIEFNNFISLLDSINDICASIK
jgi:RNA-directed DNA polymerase